MLKLILSESSHFLATLSLSFTYFAPLQCKLISNLNATHCICLECKAHWVRRIIWKRTMENVGKPLSSVVKWQEYLLIQNSPPWFLSVWFVAKKDIPHWRWDQKVKQTSLKMVSVIGRVMVCLIIPFLSSGKFLPSNRGASGKNGCSGSWVVLLMALWVERLEERNLGSVLLHRLCWHICLGFWQKPPTYFKELPPDYW